MLVANTRAAAWKPRRHVVDADTKLRYSFWEGAGNAVVVGSSYSKLLQILVLEFFDRPEVLDECAQHVGAHSFGVRSRISKRHCGWKV